MMSSWVNVVLTFPRYFLITGLTVLALVFFSDQIRAMGTTMDFELVLPYALGRFVPAGLLGFLIAGLLAAFMSNFAATVNAAPPYFVNDIYKRFINPNASPRTYVRLSYLSSFAVVLVGVAIGWYVASVNSVVLWIVSGLWGGYTASNVLKWYWWRFNGYGYFWGMVTGITGSLILPTLLPRVSLVQGLLQAHPVNMDVALVFPLVLAISLVGCLAGTLLTKPADEEVLKDFYRRVRPWGFWEPILAKVRAENPAFERNKDFWRDMFNVVVGIVWQVSLVALPIYLVIRKSNSALVTVAIIAVTSIVLKFTWYNHLKAGEAIDQAIARTDAVQSMPTD
jgi:Na+/proline symporter/heme/copper-type cytochrome/quinol oxidase subunit 4